MIESWWLYCKKRTSERHTCAPCLLPDEALCHSETLSEESHGRCSFLTFQSEPQARINFSPNVLCFKFIIMRPNEIMQSVGRRERLLGRLILNARLSKCGLHLFLKQITSQGWKKFFEEKFLILHVPCSLSERQRVLSVSWLCFQGCFMNIQADTYKYFLRLWKFGVWK